MFIGYYSQRQAERFGTVIYWNEDKTEKIIASEVIPIGSNSKSNWDDAVCVGKLLNISTEDMVNHPAKRNEVYFSKYSSIQKET